MSTRAKVLSWFTAILLVGGAGLVYFRFYYPFTQEGVKAGELNQIMHKGWIWKTYEGTLILTGIKSNQGTGIMSNQFDFSVTDPALADSLMHLTGKMVQLKYKEYKGALPWRGMQKKIVYEIQAVLDGKSIDSTRDLPADTESLQIDI